MAKVGLNLGLNRCLQTTKNHKIKKVASALSTELFPQTIIYSAITKDSLFLIPLG